MEWSNFQPKNQKLLGLEILRFISALSILVWHYQHFFYMGSKATNIIKMQQPFYRFLFLFYNYGYLGVHVFWCVSGYIFFWKYKESIAGKILTLNNFFVLRFSRLYPLHFATLLLVAFLQILYFAKNDSYFVFQNNDISHFILQLFFASSWGLEKGASFNEPIWSISLEVLVYFFFFLILSYVSKSVFVSIAILLLCVIAKINHISSLIVDCAAFFYAGGLSAYAFNYLEKTKYKGLIQVLALGILLITPLLAYIINLKQHNYFLAYIAILVFMSAKKMSMNPTIEKIIQAAGNMTYSSYLIHFPIQLSIALYFTFIHKEIPYYSKSFFIGFLLTTLVVSYYIYRFFELPAQNYIRRNYLFKKLTLSIESDGNPTTSPIGYKSFEKTN